MAPAEIEVKVKIPAIPELAACMFTRMASDDQAETLKLIWEKMRDEYGGEYKAAMQCAYIRDDITPEAYDLLEHLTAVDEPEGFVLPVHREPSLAELLHARRYINARLAEHGADVPKTYTVEKTHDDGTTSTVSGLTADEVLECYHGADHGEDLFHAKTQRLAQAFPATPEGGYVERIEGGTFAPAPAGFVQAAIDKAVACAACGGCSSDHDSNCPQAVLTDLVTNPDYGLGMSLDDNFAAAIEDARAALGVKKGGPFDDALTAFLNSGVTSIEVLYDYVPEPGPLGVLGAERVTIRERNARVRVEFIDTGARPPYKGEPFEFNGTRLGVVEDSTTQVGNYTTTTVMMQPFIDDAGSDFDPLQARSCCPTFINEEHADSCQSKPPVVNVIANPDVADALADGKADQAIIDALSNSRDRARQILFPDDDPKSVGPAVDDGSAREQWADAGTRVPQDEKNRRFMEAYGIGGGKMVDALQHGRISASEPNISNAPKGATCDECKGTGFWINPAGGRNGGKSPCSMGCKP